MEAAVEVGESGPGPEAGGSTAAGAVRDTPEYKAAWDLELWKEQQKARFLRMLEDEKEALYKDLRRKAGEEARRKDTELRARQEQVERLATRVGKSLEVLKTREDRIVQREEELARQRSSLAKEWEQKQRECDERIRRATEEGYFTAQQNKTRVRELEQMNETQQQKCARVEAEYSKLCDEFTRWRQEALTSRPAEVVEASAGLLAKERQAKQLAEEERERLSTKLKRCQGQVKRLRRQLVSLAEEHNRLIQHAHRQQVAHLDRERDALERSQALHAAATLREERARDRAASHQTHLAFVSPAPAPSASSPPHNLAPTQATPPQAEAAELRVLLAEAEQAILASSDQPPAASPPPQEPPPRLAARRVSPERQQERRSRAAPRPLPRFALPPDVDVAVALRRAALARQEGERGEQDISDTDTPPARGVQVSGSDGESVEEGDLERRINEIRARHSAWMGGVQAQGQ